MTEPFFTFTIKCFEHNLSLLNWYQDSFWDDENVLELDRGVGCTTSQNVLNVSELHSLKLLILCHVNFTFI